MRNDLRQDLLTRLGRLELLSEDSKRGGDDDLAWQRLLEEFDSSEDLAEALEQVKGVRQKKEKANPS